MVSRSEYFDVAAAPSPRGSKNDSFAPCDAVRELARLSAGEIRAAVDRQVSRPLERVTVGGLEVAVLTRGETALLTIGAALSRRGTGQPCLLFTTVNGQVVSLCASNETVRALYDQADVISPDGMSVVMASRLRCRVPLPERVATTDAFHDAALLAQRLGARFYFLGADERTCATAVERARMLYPDLEIVGQHCGYFSRAEEPALVERINEAAPDVLWVGMGVPRQQSFVLRNRAALTGVGVAKTCGGLFDFLAGRSSRAPDWMQRNGLEWLYRALLEPVRLGPRYVTTNPHALYHLLRHSA